MIDLERKTMKRKIRRISKSEEDFDVSKAVGKRVNSPELTAQDKETYNELLAYCGSLRQPARQVGQRKTL